MKNYISNILFCFISCIFYSCTELSICVINLRCEYEENPLGVDVMNPLLCWQLNSDCTDKSQCAYRVLVANNPESLNDVGELYWDSGKIYSTDSKTRYMGRKLSSGEQVWWKVMVWDENDQPSEWSNIAEWSMGLMDAKDWKASWIGNRVDAFPDSVITTPAPYFRKTFAIEKKVKRAMAYVSGLGFYEFYINGEKVGNQVLSPAVTNYDVRSLKNLLYYYDDQSTQRVFYNVFDVTQMLDRGSNVLGMILGNGWYNQRDRTVEGHMWYDTPKLIMQLCVQYDDGTSDIICSDKTWKTTTGPILHDAIFTGEVYDARKNLGDWNCVDYDDSSWMFALEVRPPVGNLCVQTVPYTRVMNTVETTFEQLNDSTYCYSLPETVSGWCELRVAGKYGDEVRLRYVSEEEMDYGQMDKYILEGRTIEKWEPRFTWHTFRRIEVITKGVRLSKQSLLVKNIYTDVKNVSTFECSNELFNRIVDAHNRTMHANFKGIISSDPHRERLSYTGDGQVISESLLYTYDMTRYMRKFIDDIGDAQNKQSGYVPHTAPFNGGGGGPAWGAAYVIIPWIYYQHYGDTLILRKHYDGMKHWVDYLGTRTDNRGLIVREEPGGWCLGEWCTLYNQIEIPTELVNTAYYYYVSCIMAEIAKTLGEKNDVDKFEALSHTIKDNFNKAFYNPKTNHYWQGKQGADVFALGFGLVPDEQYKTVFNAMMEHLKLLNYHFDTGIFGTPLLLQVLTENGRGDIAYQLMNQRDFPSYAYLLDDKNSTLWETWDGGGDPGGRGHCHPMFGSVVAWFYRSLAGIRPDKNSPGMKHFYVAPVPVKDLTYCKASYTTLYGKIISEWRQDKNGNLYMFVEIPVNTSATIILPQWGNSNKKIIKASSGRHKFVINNDIIK